MAVLARSVASTFPVHLRTELLPAYGSDGPGKSILDIPPQALIGGELGGLGAFGTSLCVPLRRRGPIFQITASGSCIAVQFA